MHDCDGCCDGSTCRSGGEDSACGYAALECVDCGADVCVDNLCRVDPLSRWDIVFSSLFVRGDWDAVGVPSAPDLKVVIEYGRSGAYSTTLDTVDDRSLISYDGTPQVANALARDLSEGITVLIWDVDPFVDEAVDVLAFLPDLYEVWDEGLKHIEGANASLFFSLRRR